MIVDEKEITTVYLFRSDVEKAKDLAWSKRMRVSDIYRNAVHWYLREDIIEKVEKNNGVLE